RITSMRMKQKLRLGDCYALTKHKRKQTAIRYLSLLAVLTSMCLYAVKQVSTQQAEPAATAVDTAQSVRDTLLIKEVQVNTGYQYLSPERTTGSLVYIDSALINRRVGPNILDRLDGVTPGLLFNRNTRIGQADFNIRGVSTI